MNHLNSCWQRQQLYGCIESTSPCAWARDIY